MVHLLCLLLLATAAAAECRPYTEAPARLGETLCITGKIVNVRESRSGGAWFLNFCEDYRGCPFTAVVFTRDLRHVGDVRMLAGKVVEVHGKVQDYKGQTEIIVRDSRQLKGEAAKLPPLPKEFDVERRGRFRPQAKPQSSQSTDAERR